MGIPTDRSDSLLSTSQQGSQQCGRLLPLIFACQFFETSLARTSGLQVQKRYDIETIDYCHGFNSISCLTDNECSDRYPDLDVICFQYATCLTSCIERSQVSPSVCIFSLRTNRAFRDLERSITISCLAVNTVQTSDRLRLGEPDDDCGRGNSVRAWQRDGTVGAQGTICLGKSQ
ncbi:unnamed protein product [Protopolystoma xenopodis]|uniref:Uncharacterized protein n=1 Tax=Protopolystoma xenopodis TaxID=117903 RepID=A0A3S5FBL4_9PLAT|nr:unnamed protein product [Protopolystoma xenopodis]